MSDEVCTTAQSDEVPMDVLMQAIHSANICVFYQTTDLIYRWAENLPPLLQNRWQISCSDHDLFSLEAANRMKLTKLQVLESGKGKSLELRLTKEEDEPVWFKFSINCHRDKEGKLIGLITTGVNVSESRRREQILNILLREVSHRSKNLLAIIQSIANQTARFSDSNTDFLKKFQGRLQSLAHSQDLVTDSNWRGALLQDLVRSQAKNYVDFTNTRFYINGENPYLFPGAALHIGLAFHELIINSVAFGALTRENGSVNITCSSMKPNDKEHSISLLWEEIFPISHGEEPNLKARFGSIVLERIVPLSVNGKANYEIEPGRVLYHLTMAASSFDDECYSHYF